jgi:hypothetical protein
MNSISGIFRWAVSQEKALTNARAAAVECSRQRLERAEVEAYLERVLAARQPWAAQGVTRQAR